MMTLAELQQSTVPALRRVAATTRNRQYSIACEQMAHAMEAHARGDVAARTEHVAFAVRAHKRAGEDEGGQLLRVRYTQRAIDALEIDDGAQ